MAAAGGADATIAALQAWKARIRPATIAAGGEAAEYVRLEIRYNLERSQYPPSSPPGEPPARRSGFLQENVFITELDSDSGVMERIYPSTVYARIQELGGITGAGHRTRLLARPYVGPVRETVTPEVRDIFVEHWLGTYPGR